MALIASVASRKERRRFTQLKEIIEMHYPVQAKRPMFGGAKNLRDGDLLASRGYEASMLVGPALLCSSFSHHSTGRLKFLETARTLVIIRHNQGHSSPGFSATFLHVSSLPPTTCLLPTLSSNVLLSTPGSIAAAYY
jgi:hypothetical protein